MLFVLFLLLHHGTVLPTSHACVLWRDAVTVFRHMAVGGQKVFPAAPALAWRMNMVQSVHQVKGEEANGTVKEIAVHENGFLFLLRYLSLTNRL